MTRRSTLLLLAGILLPILLLAIPSQLRDWKRIQLRWSAAMDEARTAHIAELEKSLEEDLRFHQGAIRIALDALEDRAEERQELESQLFRLRRQLRTAEQRQTRLQSTPDGPISREARRTSRREVESYGALIRDKEARLEFLLEDLRSAEAELAETRRPLDEWKETRRASTLDRLFRSLPFLDLFAPSVEIREMRPTGEPGADRHLSPTSGPRIDRCTTCHLGSAPGEEGARLLAAFAERSDDWTHTLFAPHPLPEWLAEGGSHPLGELGCISCHGGDGRSTDFARSGHWPRDDEQRQRWLDWGFDPGTEIPQEPILAGVDTQAGCVACHAAEVVLPTAPLAEAGRRVAARFGCAGCHQTGLADLDGSPSSPPRVGPALAGLPERTSRAWAREFLSAPRQWNPEGWMPDPWVGALPEVKALEIAAIVAHLWQGAAGDGAAATLPPDDRARSGQARSGQARSGQVQRGEALARQLACHACHRLAMDDRGSTTAPGRRSIEMAALNRRFGPTLVNLETKLDADWLFEWLLAPGEPTNQGTHPRHADFRLSRDEAADLVAFLLPLPDAEKDTAERAVSEARVEPTLDAELRDTLLLRRLEEKLTIEASRARLDALNGDQRLLLLGELTLGHRGCAGCHSGVGEASPPNGGSLDTVGLQLARRPRQGWLDRAHAAAGWTAAMSPSEEEEEALYVQLLGWRGLDPPSARELELARGRAVLARQGCRGCHAVGGMGGLPELEVAPGVYSSIPALDGLGAKVKADWLFAYLRDPSRDRLRPFLGVRMPTFPSNDAERGALVSTFVAEAGVSPFESPPAEIETTDATVGQVVFSVLACDRCHLSQAEQNELDVTLPAPSYEPAGRRLRASWIESWLLDPQSVAPGTAIERSFPLGADGRPDSSFLYGALETPLFQVQRQRLERLFGSPEALREHLSDPEAMARALRAHLSTLESAESRARRP